MSTPNIVQNGYSTFLIKNFIVALAAEAYAKAHRLGIDAENHAREIKFTAARRIGELVPAEQGKRTDKEQEGKRTKRTKELHQDSEKSIIPQQRLSEFRKLAEIPIEKFMERIEVAKVKESKITRLLIICIT